MISIAIPTYEMNGAGKFFLEKSLDLLLKQTYKNFEVVISDHSQNDEIEKLCLNFNNLDITYVKNDKNIGSSSANFNNAIKNCKYDIIKLLMQDDYIYDTNTLLDIKNYFNDEKLNWLITGCFYGSDINNPLGSMVPYYNDAIHEGNNTIGSPSVVAIRKTSDLELFNPDLIWLMDCDYYKRLHNKWGNPAVISEHKIFINQHEDQLTNRITSDVKIQEAEFLRRQFENI